MASNLGLSGASLLYRWKAKLLKQSGPAAATLENRVRQLESDLRRVERERDILKTALAIFRPGLIHHTDRGGQYAGVDYRKILARAEMSQSMSRAADCYDNAFMESCFGTVQTELEMEPYENEHIARKEVPDYIRYYNTRRRHSALGYLTPEAFEAQRRC